jgi:hypothetical protein
MNGHHATLTEQHAVHRQQDRGVRVDQRPHDHLQQRQATWSTDQRAVEKNRCAVVWCPRRPALRRQEADDRPHLLALGMAGYTKSGVIGRPSLGTKAKGTAVLASLTRSFGPVFAFSPGTTDSLRLPRPGHINRATDSLVESHLTLDVSGTCTEPGASIEDRPVPNA